MSRFPHDCQGARPPGAGAPVLHRLAALLVCLLCGLGSLAAKGPVWLPLPAAELQAVRPLDPAGGKAEILLERDTFLPRVLKGYRRIKIYDTSEPSLAGLLRAENRSWYTAPILAVRVIHADGTSADYDSSDFRQRDMLNLGFVRVECWQFPVGLLRAGDIVDFQWEAGLHDFVDGIPGGLVQYPVPVRQLIVEVYPGLGDADLKAVTRGGSSPVLRVYGANVPVQQSGPRWFFEASNIPAYQPEPSAPAVLDACLWYGMPASDLVRVMGGQKGFENRNWAYLEAYRKPLTGQALREAGQLIAGLQGVPAQARALEAWCRSTLTNITYSHHIPRKLWEARDRRRDWGPKETFREAGGFPADISFLFAAMARSVGLEARLFLCRDRRVGMYVPRLDPWEGGTVLLVAVRDGDAWLFLDPGYAAGEPGMIPHFAEGMPGQFLLGEGDDPSLAKTITVPVSAPAKSRVLRKAELGLDETGRLTGQVRLELSGHAAAELRWLASYRGDNRSGQLLEEEPPSAEELFQRLLQDQLPGVRITGFRCENEARGGKPLVLSFEIMKPDFAVPSGQGMSVPGCPLAALSAALFPAPERQSPVCFPYAQLIEDEVRLVLPEGWKPERAGAPSPLRESRGLLSQDHGLSWDAAGRVLVSTRRREICAGGELLHGPEMYPYLRAVYAKAEALERGTVRLTKGK